MAGKRAVVLVPGFRRREQLGARDQLVEAISYYSDGYVTSVADGVEEGGANYRRLTVTPRDEGCETLEIDVYEAY